MTLSISQCPKVLVALLAEGVDRNCERLTDGGDDEVALLAEGVDRNFADPAIRAAYLVALLAEGVDRNRSGFCGMLCRARRPPRGGRG